ncbi:MAG: Phospho-N-acetylmuramoyl-pentapeptide-transferase [Candidatus Binatus sp.]|jgi:phospho-N-acetylmuramoyl-pentapeptide-transferase|nr:Phospho-N-acetylmuramoyl-pentapeptide-transferase [Candidatus Binatus sp.]
MLYLLLYPLHKHFPGLNVLRYETLRSVFAGLAALALSLALGPIVIERFRAMRIGQTIREVVPQAHQKKAGTPTMGGLLIITAMLAATLLLANILNPYVLVALFVTITFGIIGFSDDYLKLARGKGLGVSGPVKLVSSFLCAFLAAAFLFLYLDFDTHLTVPFLKNVHPDLHRWLYIPFAMIVIVGCSHAVNLTDGLDGLAIGPVMTVALTYWVFTYVAGNIKFSTYLQVPYVANVGEVAIFCASMVAASLGFLWYNAYPASMMMGDVGALALGAAIGTVAVLAKQELALVLAGGVFVVEAASTIIQRYYFKATGGKRFFKMAPLHHHFELKGIPETVVVIRFWIASIVCALIALSTLKLR